MAVLDLQRRSQQIGRLRMGEKVGTGKFDKDGNEKMRPARRDTWRLTTASRFEAEAIAARFGGEVRQWEREWEVATDATEIPVIVPPRDEVISSGMRCGTRAERSADAIASGTRSVTAHACARTRRTLRTLTRWLRPHSNAPSCPRRTHRKPASWSPGSLS